MPGPISRRQFLAAMGATAAGTGLCDALSPPTTGWGGMAHTDANHDPRGKRSADTPTPAFRVSVINDEISQDFARACEVAARDFGMRWIELRSLWNKNVVALDSNEVLEAQRILNKFELRVSNIASPLFKVDWPGAPRSRYSQSGHFNAGFTFQQQAEVLERAIERAKAFSTDRVRCFDFWRLEDPKPYRRSINEQLRDAAEKAGARGITLLLENEEQCNTSTGAEAALVLAEVQSPHLMLNWDPANAAACGEIAYPDGYAHLPKERIGHCHCKDVVLRDRKAVWEAMGSGIVDWVGQFRALKRDGYHLAVSLETHWDGGGTPEQCSRKSWAGMQKLLREAEAL